MPEIPLRVSTPRSHLEFWPFLDEYQPRPSQHRPIPHPLGPPPNTNRPNPRHLALLLNRTCVAIVLLA